MAKRRGRGEGSVETLPSGKFRVVFSTGRVIVSKTGGLTREKLTFTSARKADALAWLRERLAERDKGRIPSPTKRSVGDWATSWLAARRTLVEPTTYVNYRQHVESEILPAAIGSLRLSLLRREDVERFYADLTAGGASAAKVNKVGKTLRQLLNAAVEADVVASNVAASVKTPKRSKSEIRPYTAEQAKTLLAGKMRPWLRAFVAMSIDGGFRQGELFALHWPEVNFAADSVLVVRSLQRAGRMKHVLKTTKTEKGRRTVTLAPDTLRTLQTHREALGSRSTPGGLVFPGRKAKYTTASTLRSALERVMQHIGVPVIRPHDLRHTCASLLLSAGVNVKVVSERLGHSSVTTTMAIYAHVMPGMQAAAASAMASVLYGVSPTGVPQED